MWNALSNIFTSSNGIFAMLLLGIVVIIATKYGLFKVQTDKVTIGNDTRENERTIIRNQKDWVKLSLEAFEQTMPKFEGYDAFRGKYIIERVYDEIVDWITYNHIRVDAKYISLKQGEIWLLVQKLTIAEQLKTTEFKEQIDEYTENIIKTLVDIRNEYS